MRTRCISPPAARACRTEHAWVPGGTGTYGAGRRRLRVGPWSLSRCSCLPGSLCMRLVERCAVTLQPAPAVDLDVADAWTGSQLHYWAVNAISDRKLVHKPRGRRILTHFLARTRMTRHYFCFFIRRVAIFGLGVSLSPCITEPFDFVCPDIQSTVFSPMVSLHAKSKYCLTSI